MPRSDPPRRPLQSAASEKRLLDNDDSSTTLPKIDTRPFEQRTNGPRPARRMNHGFKYLYRHGVGTFLTKGATTFLLEVGYTLEEVERMTETFPPLLSLSVSRQLAPMSRFLQHTLGLDMHNLDDKSQIPPALWGAPLEPVIAPRHAFLEYAGLPCGRDLIDSHQFESFWNSCRNPKQFAAFCQSWRRGLPVFQADSTLDPNHEKEQNYAVATVSVITAQHVEAFRVLFGRGLLAMARNDLVQPQNDWPFQVLPNITSAQLTRFLLQNGANVYERDHRGVTLLHWAAGTGNLDTLIVLQRAYFHNSTNTATPLHELIAHRDGATLLHWAVAGVTPREFGVGGNVHVCQYLLEQVEQLCDGASAIRHYFNRPTFDGNTPLMWAAWSGTLETVKLLVRHRANTETVNRNGCSVAHWASSGGNLPVCRYLHEVAQVNFAAPNHGGNTPLTHAVAFGRTDVVEWLRNEVLSDDDNDDAAAHSLARDFVQWTDGDDRRRKVLRLFDKWLDDDSQAPKQQSTATEFEEKEDDLLLL